MQLTASLFTLQRATLAARQRTGDAAIGTRVERGAVQVVRVVKHSRGPGCDVLPLTGFLTISEAVRAIEAL